MRSFFSPLVNVSNVILVFMIRFIWFMNIQINLTLLLAWASLNIVVAPDSPETTIYEDL